MDGGNCFIRGKDPLISAIEGASGTPAYRGLALAVFEDMALAEFGNRIPVLTFEVVADDDDPEVGEVVCDASDRTILPGVPASTPSLIGYAAYGSDRRSAIEQLAELASIRFRERDGRIGLANGTSPMPLPGTEDVGWSASGKPLPHRGEWRQEPTASLPATLAIRYHEPARDYQAGQMRATTTPGGRGELTVDSATALTAVEAKRWAQRALARRWAGRDRITLNLSSSWIGLAPGDQVELPWRSGRWTVEETTVEAFGVIVNCRREEQAGTSLSADPGRGLAQDDNPIGTSSIAVFDLPDLGLQLPDRPRLHVAVSSDKAFKPVPVATFIAGLPGPSLVVARRARLGRTLTALSPGEAWLFDASASLDVELVNPAQVLLNADDAALDGGANLAMAGSELFQFGRAGSLGSGRWRLSRLLRGRRGSEWTIASHAANEPFLMIDPASLVSIDLDQTKIGAGVEVTAHGIADDPAAPPSFSATANARALAPLAPCFLSGDSREDGLHLKWMRRSIKQWGWADGQVDDRSPVAFRVTIEGPAGRIEETVSETSLVLPWTALAAMGATPISATVVELGEWRSSPPTTAHLSL